MKWLVFRFIAATTCYLQRKLFASGFTERKVNNWDDKHGCCYSAVNGATSTCSF